MNLTEKGGKSQMVGLMLQFIIERERRKGSGTKTKLFSSSSGASCGASGLSHKAQRQHSLLRTPKMLHLPEKRSENFGMRENRHLLRQWQTFFMVILGGAAEGVIGSDSVGKEQGERHSQPHGDLLRKDMSTHYRQYQPG